MDLSLNVLLPSREHLQHGCRNEHMQNRSIGEVIDNYDVAHTGIQIT